MSVDGWQVHGRAGRAALCPVPAHVVQRLGRDPGSEPALPGVGACGPLCSALRRLLTPRGHRKLLQVRAGLQFNPRGNSLPGRPREGWSGAARPPGTPRTPRACRLRVGAGRKNPAWWTCALPQVPSPPPVGRPPETRGSQSVGSMGLLGIEAVALPELPFGRAVCSHVTRSSCDRPPPAPVRSTRGSGGHCRLVPGSRAGSVVREWTPGGASVLVSGTLRPKPGRCLSR